MKENLFTERFMRILKNKIYKHTTVVSKKFYFDVLDHIVDIYNNTYQKTIKMKPIDIKSNSYAEYNSDSNENVINDLNGEEIIENFYVLELQKTNQEEFRIEKVIKRKGNKLYVKWKGYHNSFNSWIDKKEL